MVDLSTRRVDFCQSVRVRVLTLHRSPQTAGAWPEGVSVAAVERCLAVIEARDPLTLPADRAALATAQVVSVACDVEGDVVGVAWRQATPEGAQVDVRVKPGLRRHGLGTQLLGEVAAGAAPLWAGCDAAHPRVRRFLLHQGFELAGVVFHQRWDGEPRDVPPAFASAHLETPADLAMAVSLLRDASAGTWPRPAIGATEAANGRARIAWHGDAPAGVLLAHREADAWEVDGLAVLAAHRGSGVGRLLAADLMRFAAESGVGVTLRVAQDDEAGLSWSQKLGFWTYRTWAMYRR